MVLLGALLAFVADRFGVAGVEISAMVVLVFILIGLVLAIPIVANAENCDGCHRTLETTIGAGIPACILGLGYLIVRRR